MAAHDVSSDEGEIVEATPLPRSEKNGDVDRTGRTRGRHSRTPERAARPAPEDASTRRRSRSPPRGQKRPRDDRDRRDRDPRSSRLQYDDAPRHERPRDRDRNSELSSYHDRSPDRGTGRSRMDHRDALPTRLGGRSRDDRGGDGYPDKRQRSDWRDGRDKGRRDHDRYQNRDADESRQYDSWGQHRSSNQSGAGNEGVRRSGNSMRDAMHAEGVTNGSRGDSTAAAAPDPDQDWDPESAIDQEAAAEAEIQRRKRARQEALERALRGATPLAAQLLPAQDKASPTPVSTRLGTPVNHLKSSANTPHSDLNSPGMSPSNGAGALSPAAFDLADDRNLVKSNGEVKPSIEDEDGPSAADYDPTVDMQEDERRDEMRNGHVGLHGEARHPAQKDLVPAAEPVQPKEDDAFDMFADDFDEEKFAPPATKTTSSGQDQLGPGNPAGGGNLDGDDKDGYYKIRPGELLEGRYQIGSALGRGTFSGVARAQDVTTREVVAIKIMRNNDALRKGGFTEIAILQKLNAADPEDKKHIIKFERSFEHKGHLCMAFENLSMNLREVLKKFGNNVGINLSATRAYAYQIFLALGHMRKCSIIHADLKPDNILVNEARNVLKICDLGTAIDRSDAATASTEITPYLVSRFYRAPEIILGMPYDYAIDMWSIGCTLYELYTGKILFTGDSNNQMLKNIMEIRGRLSPKMYRRGQLSNMHFDDAGSFVSVERDKILGKTAVRTLAVVKPSRDLRTRLMAASSGMNDAETRELNHFVDLLERCLALNPEKRITPSEALRHPFFVHRAPGR